MSERVPEDTNLTSLRETGECHIPFRNPGQESIPFVELIDQTREYARQLADQLGIEIITSGRWSEELGHHLHAWKKE